MKLTAYPKINLGLDILTRRPDGYHEIDTLMVAVPAVADTLEIEHAEGGGCSLQIEGLVVDCASDRNLVVKAWMLLREMYAGIHETYRVFGTFGRVGYSCCKGVFQVSGNNP